MIQLNLIADAELCAAGCGKGTQKWCPLQNSPFQMWCLREGIIRIEWFIFLKFNSKMPIVSFSCRNSLLKAY